MATSKKTPAKKAVKTSTRKTTSKKTTPKNQVVDFEPNKMGFAVASLSAVTLVLLGMIAMSN